MKKYRVLFVIAMILCAHPVWSYTSPFHKLTAGAKQVVTGPFSILTVPVQQMDHREHDQALGFLGGLLEGATQMVVVPLKGLFNIITFPIVDYTYSLSE